MENVYIMSLEGAEIWEHINRGERLNKSYVGMLPYSLELEKLDIKTFTSKRTDKIMTNDIINVKFNEKVKSAEEITANIDKKILNLSSSDEVYADGLIKYRDTIEKEKDLDKWKEIKNDDLRSKLYEEGFALEFEDKNKKISKIEYVVYKRSSAKSRTGQVLFIKKQLHNKMIKWARIGMNLDGRSDIDYPSLLSYESLVGSSLEDIIHIPVENILIVDDVKSVFPVNVNIVGKDKNGLLISRPQDNYLMENDIFDGEGLLDNQYFTEDREEKGMMLLRQHMFKCCVFNCNIQQFLRDCAKENGMDFDTWELKNKYGDTILAKNVYMIITPNSLKALKFNKIKGSNHKMWIHWKNKVKEEGCIFGICKSEKESKRGYDEEGNIINQTSYQMLNSMSIPSETMQKLSQFELDYIEKLKNNDDTYVKYLEENSNDMNCNKMLVDLYNQNKNIVKTKIFKDKRKKDIHNYINHVKKGKVRLNGDYTTIMQNGKELLFNAIGALPVENGVLNLEAWKNEMILKENEVYTTLHEFDKEYVGFRNPHTSPSNVLIVKNTDSNFIRRYFNLTDNIIYTNAINFPINRILSGQDVDSDNLILFNSSEMLENARKCYVKSSNYKVCVNGVNLVRGNEYKVTATDMSKIDNTLAQSQKCIGTIVNLGQLYMSTYWDSINKGEQDQNKLDTLLQGVDICTILSEISIDMAKRLYDVDIEKQIKDLEKCKYLNKNKPMFFKYISQSKTIGNKVEEYETSMDYLYKIMDNIKYADGRKSIQITTLLKDVDAKKVKNRQINGLVTAINHLSNNIKYIETFMSGEEEWKKNEKYNALDDAKNEHMQIIKRYKIKTETVAVIIYRIFKDIIECKYKTDLLNTLYKANPKEFLEAFKTKK